MKVFPGKKRLIFPETVIPPVERGLRDAFFLFAGEHIQNNWSETTNNVLRSVMCMTAMMTVEHLRGRTRGLFAIRNDASAIPKEVLSRNHHIGIVLNRMLNKQDRAKDPEYKTNIHQD